MSLKTLIFAIAILPFASQAQSLSKKETSSLFSLLQEKINTKANNKRTIVPTEFFFLILETDSNCNISKVHCYSDSKVKDSSYRGVSELSEQDFKSWRPKKAKDKIIVIPIISSAPSDGDYVHQIFSDLFWQNIRKERVLIEKNKTIMTNIFLYSVATKLID